jgi:plastocyanin
LIRLLRLLFVLGAAAAQLQAANISGKVTVARAPNNAEAVVYIDKIPGKTFVPPTTPAKLDQLNLKFVPHVLAITVGTKVAFPNSDITRHNVFSPDNTQNLHLGVYSQGEIKYKVFDKAGVVTLLCNIHAEMSAYIVVTETPWRAISDAAGNYTIPDVPPGRYVLRVWHEGQKTQTLDITVANDDLKGVNFDLKR